MKRFLRRLLTKLDNFFNPIPPLEDEICREPIYRVEKINGCAYVYRGKQRVMGCGGGIEGLHRAQTQVDLLNHHPAIQRAMKAAA